MVKEINIKEAIMDRTSHFNIKKFKLGNLIVEGPTKILDVRKITQELFNREKKKFKSIILENSKNIQEKIRRLSRIFFLFYFFKLFHTIIEIYVHKYLQRT